MLQSALPKLKAAAMEASRNAYCRYSRFRVGAAVLSETGEIFAGCNVENASYGLTMCAERNAIFQAVAKSAVGEKKRIKALLIYTPTASATPPCGACRQVINEFGPDAEIYSVCDSPQMLHHKLSDLLPEAFGPANL
jgi:cytidine deaminase